MAWRKGGARAPAAITDKFKRKRHRLMMTRLKPAVQAVGFFLGLLLAAGSANDAMMDKLGLLGTFAICMAWLGMSMLCAAGLGALRFGREAEDEAQTGLPHAVANEQERRASRS